MLKKTTLRKLRGGPVHPLVCGTALFLILLTMQTKWTLIIITAFLFLFCCTAVFAEETMKQIRERIIKEKKPAVVYLFTPS